MLGQSRVTRVISLPPLPPPSLPLPAPRPRPLPSSTSPVRSCPPWGHHRISWRFTLGDRYLLQGRRSPLSAPVPWPGGGDGPAPGWPSAAPVPCPPPASRPAGRGIIEQWKDAPSIDLQSNLIGLRRPLDCFHSEQGLKKYINKSIDPMAAEVKAGCGRALPARANPYVPVLPEAAFCGYRCPKPGRAWDTPCSGHQPGGWW